MNSKNLLLLAFKKKITKLKSQKLIGSSEIRLPSYDYFFETLENNTLSAERDVNQTLDQMQEFWDPKIKELITLQDYAYPIEQKRKDQLAEQAQ